MGANVRFVFFLVVAAFFLLGPIQTQVLLGPARSAKRPYLPMRWQMYHGVGVNFCQAELFAQREGARYDYTRAELQKIIGKPPPRRKGERFVVRRNARANDVTFANEGELDDVAKQLCASEPKTSMGAPPDVRAEMRCSPPLPSGRWQMVEDGTSNLCERTKWLPRLPSTAPGAAAIDPETGEEEPEPQESP